MRQKGNVEQKPASDDSGLISNSPTPEWSGNAKPSHPSEANQEEPSQPTEDQSEQDESTPVTQEVAETLVTMKSRQRDTGDRSHKVCCTKFNCLVDLGP